MGLFSTKEERENKLKAADQKKIDKIIEEMKVFFYEGEEIEKSYVFIEDFCFFTNKRFLFLDKNLIKSDQFITSVPYSKINYVSVKRGGMKLSEELLVGVSGKELEIKIIRHNLAAELSRELLKRI